MRVAKLRGGTFTLSDGGYGSDDKEGHLAIADLTKWLGLGSTLGYLRALEEEGKDIFKRAEVKP